MRYSNTFSKWMLAAGLAVAGASALPAADLRDSYRDRPDVRSDYRDLRHDYVAIDRMRDRVAADQARLTDDYRRGRRWALERDRATLNRDKRALEAMVRDARYDRGGLREDGYRR